MALKDKHIGLAVTGSFCTLAKVFKEAERLKEAGAELYPVFSEKVQMTDTRFGTAEYWQEAFQTLCGRPIVKTIVEAEPIGPQNKLDIMVIAPCTGNTLAKLAYGITDGPVLMAAKAHMRNNKPLVLAIATNDGLSRNAKNIAAMLEEKNVFVVPFGQDDPVKKPFSIVAEMPLLLDTITCALKAQQLQPILWKAGN